MDEQAEVMGMDKELAQFGIQSFQETGGARRVVDLTDEALVDLGVVLPGASVNRDVLKDMFPHGLTIIQPELRKALRRRPGGAVINGDGESTWAGFIVVPPGQSSFTGVTGRWNVPTVTVPTIGEDPWWCSVWAGIDGYGGTDVLQAGTDQVFTYGAAQYSCWYEWFPDYSITITNLPVEPGAPVYVVITVISPSQAKLFMSAGDQGVSLTFDAPNGTSLMGNTAEWVVERPTDATTNTAYSIPEFTDVTFIQPEASTTSAAVPVTPADAIYSTMYESGVVVAQPSFSAADLPTVRYTPPVEPPGCAQLAAQIAALQKELASASSSSKPQIAIMIGKAEMKMRQLGC
jgi:Peptidase A4 family